MDHVEDEKFDVFCLGILLLEIMTIHDKANNFSNLCKLIGKGEKEIVCANIPNTEIRTFILKCLMEDPKDRPAVQELLDKKSLDLDLVDTEGDKNYLKLDTSFVKEALAKHHTEKGLSVSFKKKRHDKPKGI